MRGERLPCPDQAWPHLGSSPHARGTLLGKNPQRAIERFIPACAGNAASALSPSWPASVHPRIRGERGNACGFPSVSGGSSPHTRGTPAADDPMTALVRFIPAYAGNARSAIPRHGAVCGSSPHTRGTLGGKLDALRHVRFIPAYAGNALALHAGTSSPAVHPRIRGERNDPENSLKIKDGSSPHTRGTLGGFFSRFCARRFIPAYAGNAVLDPRHAARPPVHPRIRGERTFLKFCRMADGGSSPHTRGTPESERNQHLLPRFIPAYAGNASAPQQRGCPGSVHPRIRGERSYRH